ncbi:MAG: hypothetical protein Q9224_004968 [Gallowayella concinna]
MAGMLDGQSTKDLLAETLQYFELVEVVSGLTREYEILYTKLSVQRTRLVLWGKFENIGYGGTSSSRAQIAKLLALRNIFSDQMTLLDQSGLSTDQNLGIQHAQQSPSPQNSGSRGIQLFKRSFNTYLRQLGAPTGVAVSSHLSGVHVGNKAHFSTFVTALEGLLDDLFAPEDDRPAMHTTLRWRDHFYEEISLIFEDSESLSLLVDARSGPSDIFANIASQRLIEREARRRLTAWKRYRTVVDESDRFVFDIWHRLLHTLLPKRIRTEPREIADEVSATISHRGQPMEKACGYMMFCSSVAGSCSDTAEIDLSTTKSNSDLSTAILRKSPWLWRNDEACKVRKALVGVAAVRLVQLQIKEGRTKILARDSLPPATEIQHNRYAMAVPVSPLSRQRESYPYSKKTKVDLNQSDDEEKQNTQSVVELESLIYDKLFGHLKTQDGADVLDLLPRNLGPALLSAESETSIGWGIELVEVKGSRMME